MWKPGISDIGLKRVAQSHQGEQEDSYETRYRGLVEIDGNMLVKVDIFKNGEIFDGAWGKWNEILTWLDEKGYPPLDEK